MGVELMDTEAFIFIIVAIIAIVSALSVIIADEILRSLMGLFLSFISVAGVFLFLNAEFVALFQIFVYVGAIAVVLAFGIMLTKRTLVGTVIECAADQVEDGPKGGGRS